MPSSSGELRSKLLSKLGITKQQKTTSINDRRTRDIRHMSRYTLPLLYDEEEEKIREMSRKSAFVLFYHVNSCVQYDVLVI